MLTIKLTELVIFLLKIINKFKCLPLTWEFNKTTCTLTLSSSKGKARYLAFVNTALYSFFTFGTLIGLYQFFQSNPNISERAPALLHAGGLLVLIFLTILCYMYENDLIILANIINQTIPKVCKKFNLTDRTFQLPEIICHLYVMSSCTIPVVLFVYLIIAPMNLYTFYIGNSLCGRIGYALFANILMLNKMNILNFLVVISYQVLNLIPIWLKMLLNYSKRKKPWYKFFRQYNLIRIHLTLFQNAYTFIIGHFIFLGCSLLIFSSTLIILWHKLFHIYITLLLINVIFTIGFSLIFGMTLLTNSANYSTQFLQYMKHKEYYHSKWSRIKLKCLKPLCYNCSHLFLVDRCTILVLIEFVVRNICTFVLMHGK